VVVGNAGSDGGREKAEAAGEETGEEDFRSSRDEKEGKGLPLSVGVGGETSASSPVAAHWCLGRDNEAEEREKEGEGKKIGEKRGFTYIYKKLIHPPILNILNLSFIH